MVHHPLEGSARARTRLLEPGGAVRHLFGAEPVLRVRSARRLEPPGAGLHDNVLVSWPVIPSSLRALFVRAFTDGVRDPVNGRVRESEWRVGDGDRVRRADVLPGMRERELLRRRRDDVLVVRPCSSRFRRDCGSVAASSCSTTTRVSHAHHLERNSRLRNPDRRVDRHPSEPDRWGLRNLSADTWTVSLPDGEQTIRPGRAVVLRAGLHIDFGSRGGRRGDFVARKLA